MTNFRFGVIVSSRIVLTESCSVFFIISLFLCYSRMGILVLHCFLAQSKSRSIFLCLARLLLASYAIQRINGVSHMAALPQIVCFDLLHWSKLLLGRRRLDASGCISICNRIKMPIVYISFEMEKYAFDPINTDNKPIEDRQSFPWLYL